MENPFEEEAVKKIILDIASLKFSFCPLPSMHYLKISLSVGAGEFEADLRGGRRPKTRDQ